MSDTSPEAVATVADPEAERLARVQGTNAYALLESLLERRRFVSVAEMVVLRRALLKEKDATDFRPEIDRLMDHFEDDALAALYAEAQAEIEEAQAKFEWVRRVAEAGIHRRLLRAASPMEAQGVALPDDAERKTVKLPHPSLEIKLEPVYGPYTPDPLAIETILPKLKPDERDLAVKIEPARKIPRQVIPAHTVDRVVSIGSTTSLKALRDRYAGTQVGKLLAHELTRKFVGWKLTIKPAKTAKNVTPEQAALRA